MKKVLALILAVLMVASLAVTMISAETKINVEEVCPDYTKNYIGPATETAPVLDGVIGENEYTWSRTNMKIIDQINGKPEHIDDSYTNVIGEYAAYDADWLYYATTVVKMGNIAGGRMMVRLTPDYYIGTELPTFSTGRDVVDPLAMIFEYNASAISSTMPEGKAKPTETDIQYKVVNNDGFVTSELKISRAYLAAQIGLESAADFTKFIYSTYLGWTYFNCANGAWSYIYIDHQMTDADREALKAAGVTTPLEFATSGTSSKLLAMLVLGEEPAEEEPVDPWKELAEDRGFNIHVDPVEKTPVLDGVISEGEYPNSKTTVLADLHGNGPAELQGENVVEYFGHDGEFIYYAAVYTRATINRAFWPQFKMNNSFDVYSTINDRTNVQLRLSNVGHTYQNGIGAQSGFDAPVFGEDVIATAARVGDVETFEVKFPKAFFAAANDITDDDVKVIPYYTYFHDVCAAGVVLSEDDVAAIKEAGGPTLAAGTLSYNFMVLDGEPTYIEERIEASTKSTASVRISEQNPGLRFKTTVSTEELGLMVNKFGAENVKVGTLIAPADKVGAKALTHAFGTAGVDYLDVVADVTDPFGTEGANTVFAGSIANIKTANLNRDFTAVGYIAYFDGEAWNYRYSAAAAEKNVSDVAYAAYTDIAFEEAEGYTNEIVGEGDTLKGAYSPYTEVQRAVLRALIVEINIKDNFGGDIFAD